MTPSPERPAVETVARDVRLQWERALDRNVTDSRTLERIVSAALQVERDRAEAAERERDEALRVGPGGRSALTYDEVDRLLKARERAEGEVARLQRVVTTVCEQALGTECAATCDTYGHAETCGAVDAAAHARNLASEAARLRHFIDFTVREWLADDDWHQNCDASCKHRAYQDSKYEAIEAVLTFAPPGSEAGR